MITISKRVLFWFMLVVNILFFFYGLGTVLVVLVVKVDQPIAIKGIVNGVLDFVVGICGLVGMLKRNRVVLTVYVGLQVLQLLLVIIALIVQPFIAAHQIKGKNSQVKNDIIKKYGSQEDPALTAKINEFQVKHSCCHFFSDPADNVFLKTPWYIAENHGKPAGHTMRTLPDSCCVRAEDPCRFATDVKEAITKGAVVSQDCADTQADQVHRGVQITLVWLLLALLFQIPIVLVTAIGLYQNKYFFFQEEADFTDEPVTE